MIFGFPCLQWTNLVFPDYLDPVISLEETLNRNCYRLIIYRSLIFLVVYGIQTGNLGDNQPELLKRDEIKYPRWREAYATDSINVSSLPVFCLLCYHAGPIKYMYLQLLILGIYPFPSTTSLSKTMSYKMQNISAPRK